MSSANATESRQPSTRTKAKKPPAVGAHSIEDVYRDRAALVGKTKELASPDLGNMGLEIVSLTIRQIAAPQPPRQSGRSLERR